MRVKIDLLSNTIFGSGKTVPGAEDISILIDENGFPYLRGATLKGILREEIENIVDWTKGNKNTIKKLFGQEGEYSINNERLIISDFTISENIKNIMLAEENISDREITNCFTGIYTFTKIENGTAAEGSLRSCRYINKGTIFYGEILMNTKDEKLKELISNGLKAVKYIGTMRTRGFGKVKLSEVIK